MKLTLDARPDEVREKSPLLAKSLAHLLAGQGLPPSEFLRDLGHACGCELSKAEAPADNSRPHAQAMDEMVERLDAWYVQRLIPAMTEEILKIIEGRS